MHRFASLRGVAFAVVLVALGGCSDGGGGGVDATCTMLEAKVQTCFDVTLQQLVGSPCSDPSGMWAEVETCRLDCVVSASCAEIQAVACDGLFSDSMIACYAGCRPPDYVCADGSGTYAYYYRCDGDPDCADAADEAGCPEAPTWACATGPEEIPLDWRCDSIVDCGDASDESVAECGGFTCANAAVIPATFECDQVPHCADASDEHLDCGYLGVCAP